jgi:hypothetical protein
MLVRCGAKGERLMLAQTIQLFFRILFVWAGGLLLAVAVRALLPDQSGLSFSGAKTTLFIPYSRMGFWTCVWAAVTVTILVVVRAMVSDLGPGAAR